MFILHIVNLLAPKSRVDEQKNEKEKMKSWVSMPPFKPAFPFFQYAVIDRI